MEEIFEVNGVRWKRYPELKYAHNYEKIIRECQGNRHLELSFFRELFRNDLWALVYFGMGITVANHPWWVNRCRDLEKGPKTNTLDLWAREHGKSSIITIAETVQDLLRDPEERVAIFSYSRGAAMVFLRAIKHFLEHSAFLKACFPDVLYENPQTEAPKWGEETGLYIKRRGAHKEASVEAWGLVEGMPTGRHFSKRIYDDIETLDVVNTPEMMQKVKDAFDMSQYLGAIGGRHRVAGTFYHHDGPLIYIKNKKRPDGSSIYETRTRPGTENGDLNGKSLYMPDGLLDEYRANRRMFSTQILLDPTPMGEETLDPNNLVEVLTPEIPQNLFKFMLIDPAGTRVDRRGDDWAIAVIGIEPYRDDLGASNLYVLDLVIEEMSQADALDTIVKMYLRNGRIIKLCVEKVGLSTAEVHISNALRTKGISLTVENNGIYLLRPAGRSKAARIESNISWPLVHGKIHLSAAIPQAFRQRLKMEMQKFPYWRDDGLDILAYSYDVLRDYRFGAFPMIGPREKPDRWLWDQDGGGDGKGWMVV